MKTNRRRQWREDRDEIAEARLHDHVGRIFELNTTDAVFLPASVQVGWSERRHIYGGLVYCLTCRPTQPTDDHVAVIRESVVATRECVICHRRLEDLA